MTYHTITWLKICASDWVSRRCIEPTWRTGVAARPVAVAITLGGVGAPTPVAWTRMGQVDETTQSTGGGGAAGLPDITAEIACLLILFQSVCHAMELRQQKVLFGNGSSPSPLPCVRQPSPLLCLRQQTVALSAWKENHKCVWSHAGAPSSAGIASVLSWPSPATKAKTSCRSAPIAGQVSMASRGSPRRDPIYDHAQYRRRVPVSECGRIRL